MLFVILPKEFTRTPVELWNRSERFQTDLSIQPNVFSGQQGTQGFGVDPLPSTLNRLWKANRQVANLSLHYSFLSH